ncbi:shikimate dehydrogenase [Arcanobacterium phocisimile]|uniref:Shikimate dehydrogenase (NADP(+)) n=1 Tax=Arcanobacterium phocisimile TaxID=1302235 RepID=A0ABX7IE50_9ACTO|nr:shikimate dehydrogenase [Arcanobacterium phocisimile]QRV01414.1 shikimate dehydrogenase [Arcanobacterium phocisimile]
MRFDVSQHSHYRYGLIGSPIAHSLSPAIHHASFERLGIDASYELLPTEKFELQDRLTQSEAAGFTGLNVTMPLKRAIVPLMDELTSSARLAQSVNTVLFRDGKRIGHSTDGPGMLRPLCQLGNDLTSMKIVILGTGGAGAAVTIAAMESGVSHVWLLNRLGRGLARGHQLSSRLSVMKPAYAQSLVVAPLDYEPLTEAIVRSADVVVNCTSLGMAPDYADRSPVPQEWLSSHHTIMDAVYSPIETRLLEMGRRAGAETISGVSMLVAQGLLAEEFWLDCKLTGEHWRFIETGFPDFLA